MRMPTWISRGGRQEEPRSHLEKGGLGLWTLYMVMPLHTHFWQFCKFTEDGSFFCLGRVPSQLLGGESESELSFGLCCSVTGKILHLVCACS